MHPILNLKQIWREICRFFGEGPYKSPINACPAKPLVGDNWKAAAEQIFPGQQTFQNCGIQSVRQLIEQSTQMPISKTELEFMNDAIKDCNAGQDENHPDDSGGTSADTRACILKSYGVPSSIQDASVENIDLALRERKGVIISTAADVLWDGRIKDPPSGRHAVVVTHGAYDNDGHLTGVYVNDTGINQRYLLTIDELDDAIFTGSGKINVTDNPIWPSD